MSVRYRADIDGLRALAVSSVVLYHAGIPAITGGFVGVDVFFVISGYLITSIVASEIAAGSFSVLQFYERRVRRIFPALFLVIAVSSVIGALVLLPNDLREFGESVISATAFVSNIFFWGQSGYFDGPAELKPLLHTWSLAVEEQYYIFFPLLLLVLVRFSNRVAVRIVLVAIALLSFVLSVWAVHNRPVAAFYWAPTRAWELLLGAIVALDIVPPIRSGAWRESSGALGLLLIAGSVLTLGNATPFPGLAAAPSCLGATLFIHAHRHGETLAGRSLSLRPIVFVGLISYSLYLWHWPIFVYARYVNIEPLTSLQNLVLVVISILLATLSWHFVERPFRKTRPNKLRAPAFIAGSVAMSCAAACGTIFVFLNGLPNRLPENVLAVTNDKQYRSVEGECHMVYAQKLKSLCLRGATGGAPSFILVGDSHAGAVADSVFEAAKEAGISGYQLSDSGYSPTYVYTKWGEEEKFRFLNKRFTTVLDGESNIALVLIVVYWTQAILQNQYYDSEGNRVTGDVAVYEGIKALANRYPSRTFMLMEAPPHSPLFGAHVRAREMLFRHFVNEDVSTEAYRVMRMPYADILHRLAALPNVITLDIEPYICSTSICPAEMKGGALMYRDDNHLSVGGAEFLVPMFRKYFWPLRVAPTGASAKVPMPKT